MQTKEAILTRRSIRQYTEAPVSKELLEELVKSAMSAPSAQNRQPWHFVIIQDKKKLLEISQNHAHAAMAPKAQAAILICADSKIEETEGFWVQGCAAAMQNLLLAAHDQKLGAVWIGLYPRTERMKTFQKIFNLPQNIMPFSIAVLGHPNEKKAKEERFRKERLHYEKW